jgi:hypothetical protein
MAKPDPSTDGSQTMAESNGLIALPVKLQHHPVVLEEQQRRAEDIQLRIADWMIVQGELFGALDDDGEARCLWRERPRRGDDVARQRPRSRGGDAFWADTSGRHGDRGAVGQAADVFGVTVEPVRVHGMEHD